MGFIIIKIIHITAAFAWMAGLFYLPRLFVYHASAKNGSSSDTVFKVMEHKLYHYIMLPSMILVWSAGTSMAITLDLFSNMMFSIKLLAVCFLTVYNFYLKSHLNKFKSGNNNHSSKFFRIINEIPTILLIIIISIIVIKPYYL